MARSNEKVRTRLGVTLLALPCLAVAFGVSGCGESPPGLRRLSIATGGTGGVYYVYGGAMARVLSRHLDGVEATAEVTAASAENVELLHQGAADLGFVLADTAQQAVAGEGRFGEPRNVRLLAVLYENVTHLVTTGGSGVERLDDLRGRRVSVGAPNSGTELIAERTLAAAGLAGDGAIERERLGARESVDALRDGRIQAFFWSGGLPTGAILELAHSPGVSLRLIDTAVVLPELRRVHGEVYRETVISPGTYENELAVGASAVPSLLLAAGDLDADLVHDVLAALFDHRDELEAAHPAARSLSLEVARGPSTLPLHVGAERFYASRTGAPTATGSH